MHWVPIVIAVWLSLAASAGLLAVALGRAASIGDDRQREQLMGAQGAGQAPVTADRRVGSDDRRAQERPWASEAPGRRAEDVLRRDLADARRALADAESRIAAIEARRSA